MRKKRKRRATGKRDEKGRDMWRGREGRENIKSRTRRKGIAHASGVRRWKKEKAAEDRTEDEATQEEGRREGNKRAA